MKLLVKKSIEKQYTHDKIVMMSHYVKYCARALNITSKMNLYIVDERKKYGIETTGSYFFDKGVIFIYAKNRSFVDVLRSISHELVHVKQHEKGFDKKHDMLHFDSELEDEANTYGMSLLNAYSEVMGHDIIYEN